MLYQYSAHGSHCNHCFGQSWDKHLKPVGHFCLAVLLWMKGQTEIEIDVEEVEKITPNFASEDGVAVTDIGLWDTMKCTIPSMKTRATKATMYGWDNRMKCTYLEKRLTTKRMTDFPMMRGSPSTSATGVRPSISTFGVNFCLHCLVHCGHLDLLSLMCTFFFLAVHQSHRNAFVPVVIWST